MFEAAMCAVGRGYRSVNSRRTARVVLRVATVLVSLTTVSAFALCCHLGRILIGVAGGASAR